MASVILSLTVSLLLCAIFLLSSPVLCSDKDEDSLLQGINSYRTSLRLPSLAKNDKAGCLADKIAEKLDDKPCTAAGANSVQLSDFPELLSKCEIDINHTTDGAVLPVCVPKLVPTLVLTNYTHGPYARYINDSKFTGAGLGSEDDWMIIVLTTNTPGGTFAAADRLISSLGFGRFVVPLLVAGMLVLVIF